MADLALKFNSLGSSGASTSDLGFNSQDPVLVSQFSSASCDKLRHEVSTSSCRGGLLSMCINLLVQHTLTQATIARFWKLQLKQVQPIKVSVHATPVRIRFLLVVIAISITVTKKSSWTISFPKGQATERQPQRALEQLTTLRSIQS